MNRSEAWTFKLRILQLELDHFILATPTGLARNLLCDLNIQLNAIAALPNPITEKERAE